MTPNTPYSGQKPTKLVSTKTPATASSTKEETPSTNPKYTDNPAIIAFIVRIVLSKMAMFFFIPVVFSILNFYVLYSTLKDSIDNTFTYGIKLK